MSIRLIDTTTIKMKVFTGLDVPKYAILSHTWTLDEEVSYQEATRIASDPDHPAAARSGYRKILDTCRMAKSHGYHYAWVDTCCIDKTSSAELGEAINSMFKWYAGAAVCYVYLADLAPSPNIRDSLGSCRWFTRGWCLQELLAPGGDNLEFYDKSWGFVGTKARLKLDIARITGIDRTVLAGTRLLRTIPVAQRMSWAAERNTTRVEDMAYCLLGIFDVNMPMLYGEGEKAFMRLQEEIIRRSNDLSIFCSSSSAEDVGKRLPWQTAHGIHNERQFDVTYMPYRDLFARSPKGFGYCGDVEFFRNEAISRRSFELTNNGLHFKEAELTILAHERCYSIPLNCQHRDQPARGNMLELGIILWKIGPGVFARLHSAWIEYIEVFGGPKREEPLTSVEEAYITLTITPELNSQVSQSHTHAIKFVSKNSPILRDALQDPVPRNQWDAPSLQFLTFGEDSFEGYLKVFPEMIGEDLGDEESYQQYFYVCCGLEMGLPPRVWVRLFSQRSWRKHEQTQGRMVGLKYLGITGLHIPNTDFTRDELELDGSFIQAVVKEVQDHNGILIDTASLDTDPLLAAGIDMFRIDILLSPSETRRPGISRNMPAQSRRS